MTAHDEATCDAERDMERDMEPVPHWRLLNGTTIVMSGATKGPGAQVALALAERGANICLLTHNPQDAAALVTRIDAVGGHGYALPCMVDDDQALNTALDATQQYFGTGINAIFTNMGLMPAFHEYPRARMSELSGDQWSAYMNGTARGVFVSTALAMRRMIKQPRGGVIINTALYGLQAKPDLALYTASRGAIRALVDTINTECKADNVPVSAHLLVCEQDIETCTNVLAAWVVRLCEDEQHHYDGVITISA